MWCVPWDWERCAWWTLEHDEGSSRCRQTKERVCRLAGCRHRLQGRGGGGGKDPKKFTDGTRTDRGGLPHGVSPVREAVPAPAPAPPPALRLYGARQPTSPAARRGSCATRAPHSGRGRGRLRRWPHEDQMLRLGVDELGVRAHAEQADGRQRDGAGEHLCGKHGRTPSGRPSQNTCAK